MMLSRAVDVARMIKFSHSVFALPFALVSVFLACLATGRKLPPAAGFIAWLVCMISARAFAMTYNRIADRRLDAINPRTRQRELPSGKISVSLAAKLLGAFMLVFTVSSASFYLLYRNPWPFVLGPVVLIFLGVYSFSKRFTVLCHFWLGASLGLAPLASWVAFSPPTGPVMAWPPVILALAVTFWTAGFDIIYSLADFDFDRREGIYSIAAKFGIPRALVISRLCHVITIVLLASLLLMPGFGKLYMAAIALSAGMFAFEHWLVYKDLKNIDAAFFTVNGAFSIVFAVITLADLYKIWK